MVALPTGFIDLDKVLGRVEWRWDWSFLGGFWSGIGVGGLGFYWEEKLEKD
jgi:hypothetical protein